MDRKTAGLLGAVAGLATITTAQRQRTPRPMPPRQTKSPPTATRSRRSANPLEALKLNNAVRAVMAATPRGDQIAQGYYPYHSNPYYYAPPAYYGSPYSYRPYYHHYYHHHHHRYHHHHHEGWR
jgi:hypothetical protein